MKKPFRNVLCFALVTVAACGSTPTGPQTPSARIQLTANPSSITPAACAPTNCGANSSEVEAITSIEIRETAGGSGTLDGFTVLLRRDSDNSTILNTIVGIGAGIRFGANQTVTIPFAIHFPRSQAGNAMTLTLTANARDDNANAAVTASLTVPVAAFGG